MGNIVDSSYESSVNTGCRIQIFNNPQFGEIRIQLNDEYEPMFCALDVCNALGYSNGRDAIANHVSEDDVAKRDAWVVTGKKSDGSDALRNTLMTFVNESGLYSLIFGSKQEQAKQFKKWVTKEVLPSIRKTGTYSIRSQYVHNLEELTKARL